MPKRKRWKRPASAAPSSPRVADWAKFGAAWGDIAHSALGSPILAGLVAGAVTCLGVLVENELSSKAQAAARARSASPAVDADPPQSAAATDDVEDAPDDDTDSRASADTAEVPPAPPPPPIDPKAAEAASALGIGVDATADEIRAALRARLSASRLHPDHGGDGEEAKRLIAAKNFLIERAKRTSA